MPRRRVARREQKQTAAQRHRLKQGMEAAQTRSVQELEHGAAGSGAPSQHTDVRPSFDITLITRARDFMRQDAACRATTQEVCA